MVEIISERGDIPDRAPDFSCQIEISNRSPFDEIASKGGEMVKEYGHMFYYKGLVVPRPPFRVVNNNDAIEFQQWFSPEFIEDKRQKEIARQKKAEREAFLAKADEEGKPYLRPSEERDAFVYKLRGEGKTFREIGEQIGLSMAGAHAAFKAAEWRIQRQERIEEQKIATATIAKCSRAFIDKPKLTIYPLVGVNAVHGVDGWQVWTPEMQARENEP